MYAVSPWLMQPLRRGVCASIPRVSIVTRIAPSQRLPGLQGVFLTQPVKKFRSIGVLPDVMLAPASATFSGTISAWACASSKTSSDNNRGSATSDAMYSGTEQSRECSSLPASRLVKAPSFVCNLACAPQRSISLRRFLALRHQYSTGYYFYIATETGWFLVVPSTHAALPDKAKLHTWMARLGQPRVKISHTGNEMQQQQQLQEDNNNSNMNEEDLIDSRTSSANNVTTRSVRTIRRGVTANQPPRVIPEHHLFEINDGVYWPLPPSTDLASPAYWRGHCARMMRYEDAGNALTTHDYRGGDSGTARLFSAQQEVNKTTRGDTNNDTNCTRSNSTIDGDVDDNSTNDTSKDHTNPTDDVATSIPDRTPSQANMTDHTAAVATLVTSAESCDSVPATYRANVALCVDEESGVLSLRTLVDLPAGAELLLHYGREWWTGRLLSPLFLNVSDAEMPALRWIEQLCIASTDVSVPFPRLRCRCVHRAEKSVPSSVPTADTKTAHAATATAPQHATWHTLSKKKCVLYNTATRRCANDAEVLIGAVRRSCTHTDFLAHLLHDGAVFDVAACDVEVPLGRLRRALTKSLRADLVASSQRSSSSVSAKQSSRSDETSPTQNTEEEAVSSENPGPLGSMDVFSV